MNELINLNAVQTMSSLEIAKLTGKDHSNVLRDIRNMIANLGYSELNSNTIQGVNVSFNEKGQTKEILLDEDHTLTLVSGYEVKLRMAIIKRWKDLEAKQKPQLPTNYIEALQALVESELAKESLKLELDKAHAWLSIKRVAKLNGKVWSGYSWRKLKAASVVCGYAPHKIFDANYGEVNTYNVEAWKVAYPEAKLS